jgi:signal peptidase I
MELQSPSEFEPMAVLPAEDPREYRLHLPGRQRAIFKTIVRHLSCLVVVVALAFGSFHLISHFGFQSVQVVGASMSPTLQDSERYLLNRFIYHVRDPQPREIVVLRDPEDNAYAVKRIVAKEGDTVVLRQGHLYVNDVLLDEPYLAPNTRTFPAPRYREQMWICGVDQYFVLGDNRNNSADSRIYGTISRRNILGMLSL